MPSGRDIVDEYIPQMLDRCIECDGRVLIAEVNGEIVGFVTILTKVSSGDLEDGDLEYGLVSDVMVVERFRSQGLGRKLLEVQGGKAGGGVGGRFGQRAGEGKNIRMIKDYLKRIDQQQSALAVNSLNVTHADPGAELNEPRTDFSETGAWISAVVTDKDGKGKVKVKLPDSTTGFAVVARGVTKDTYVGEGTATLRTAKKLQVGVVAPPTLTEGDRATVTAHVHNLAGERLRVDLKLSANQAGKISEFDRSANLLKSQEREFPWALTAGSAADIRLEVLATGGAHQDALRGGIVGAAPIWWPPMQTTRRDRISIASTSIRSSTMPRRCDT